MICEIEVYDTTEALPSTSEWVQGFVVAVHGWMPVRLCNAPRGGHYWARTTASPAKLNAVSHWYRSPVLS